MSTNEFFENLIKLSEGQRPDHASLIFSLAMILEKSFKNPFKKNRKRFEIDFSLFQKAVLEAKLKREVKEDELNRLFHDLINSMVVVEYGFFNYLTPEFILANKLKFKYFCKLAYGSQVNKYFYYHAFEYLRPYYRTASLKRLDILINSNLEKVEFLLKSKIK